MAERLVPLPPRMQLTHSCKAIDSAFKQRGIHGSSGVSYLIMLTYYNTQRKARLFPFRISGQQEQRYKV
jgi:hypothetical protein